MTLGQLQESIPDFGRDTRLNLEAVLSAEGLPSLSPSQQWGTALAVAHALEDRDLAEVVLETGRAHLDDARVNAAKSAAVIMAMNNVYYRAQHLMDDAELKAMPARLRMQVIGKPGIEKVDFELMCFAVSAVSGCGQCLTAHLNELRKAGLPAEGAHSALRLAAVLASATRARRI